VQGDGRPRRTARREGRRAGHRIRLRLLTADRQPSPASRIRRVELRVANVEASAELYCRLVGLEAASLSADQAELRSAHGGPTLLLLRRAERPGRPPRQATGLFHTAFRYPDRRGLANALARVEAAGATLSGVSDHGVSEALYLDDPDGLGIELYRDRPRAEWPDPGPGERVRMFTAPLDLADLAAAAGEAQAEPVEIGHVHLKVADPGVAAEFWIERMGMELMTRFGPDAVFLAYDGYHHHVGANAWFSRGAAPEPEDGPGLDGVAVVGEQAAADPATTPDGVEVLVEAAA
jgi:catechol 2,3-dioxygenase